MTLAERLDAELARLAATGETIGYGAFAERLQIAPPGRIAQLTAALEATMATDSAQGHPLRAALCEGRLTGGLPAAGFFLAARQLGRYAGPAEGPEAEAFVATERAALRARALTSR